MDDDKADWLACDKRRSETLGRARVNTKEATLIYSKKFGFIIFPLKLTNSIYPPEKR